jgi:hypothetical protein
MHDIDLIPTEVVVAMRDDERKPNWLKLQKDAGVKAALTRKRKRAGQKAAETRRARKRAAE